MKNVVSQITFPNGPVVTVLVIDDDADVESDVVWVELTVELTLVDPLDIIVDVTDELAVLDKLVDAVELIELLPDVVTVLVSVDDGVALNDVVGVLLNVELTVDVTELLPVDDRDELADEL